MSLEAATIRAQAVPRLCHTCPGCSPTRLGCSPACPACSPTYLGALTAWSELPTRGLPLLVYGLEGLQCHEHDSPSFFNPPEALKVAQLIEALLAKGAVDGTEISTGDIGVVAPFRKQAFHSRCNPVWWRLQPHASGHALPQAGARAA